MVDCIPFAYAGYLVGMTTGVLIVLGVQWLLSEPKPQQQFRRYGR